MQHQAHEPGRAGRARDLEGMGPSRLSPLGNGLPRQCRRPGRLGDRGVGSDRGWFGNALHGVASGGHPPRACCPGSAPPLPGRQRRCALGCRT
eukprot:7590687-Alexandrium_andersonii.AAC.1